MKFSGKMRQKRIELKIKRPELAEMTGLHINTIDNIECNRTDCSVSNAVKICKALNCTASDLIET